jgi:hypothetical protein
MRYHQLALGRHHLDPRGSSRTVGVVDRDHFGVGVVDEQLNTETAGRPNPGSRSLLTVSAPSITPLSQLPALYPVL